MGGSDIFGLEAAFFGELVRDLVPLIDFSGLFPLFLPSPLSARSGDVVLGVMTPSKQTHSPPLIELQNSR